MEREELDLKYRPRRFADVLGNAGVRKLLLRRSVDRTLAGRSKMFGGPKGCGKTTLARITAMALACSSLRDGEPCGECAECASILENSHPNVQEFDAASEGTVDKIRGMVKDADYGTIGDGKCVYILDEAQRLTAQAQDALLRPVESRDFLVILCTTEPDKIKVPIRSRVEEFSISAPTEDELIPWLSNICTREGIQANEAGLRMIARARDCCPRLCVLALDTISAEGPVDEKTARQFLGFDDFEAVTRILTLIDQDPMRAFSALDELSVRRSPSWIRDTVVWAITSALRSDVGANGNFPVPTGRFFEARLEGWVHLARELGRMDRPSTPDLEASLLQTMPKFNLPRSTPVLHAAVQGTPPVTPGERPDTSTRFEVREGVPTHPPSPPAPPPPPPPPPTKVAPVKASASMEIDGIRFTVDERLTTLDDKIERGSSVPAPSNGQPGLPVEFDRAHVPITEQEFVRSLFPGRSST